LRNISSIGIDLSYFVFPSCGGLAMIFTQYAFLWILLSTPILQQAEVLGINVRGAFHLRVGPLRQLLKPEGRV
jgi:hypothetical protein